MQKGSRVQTHPATDTWMKGDRFGTVTSVGPKWVSVTMDTSGRKLKFKERDLLSAEGLDKLVPVWRVENHGSIIRIVPVNELATEWLHERCATEPWQWMGKALCIDHRPAGDLLAVMAQAGVVLR